MTLVTRSPLIRESLAANRIQGAKCEGANLLPASVSPARNAASRPSAGRSGRVAASATDGGAVDLDAASGRALARGCEADRSPSPAAPRRQAVEHSARGELAPAGQPSDGVPLPCLFSNNSTEEGSGERPKALSAQQKKSACALAWNVEAMARKWGLSSLGFLTLTFADHVVDPAEAQRRLNSLSTHVLRERYPDGYVRVFERQKSGRIHYHLLVVLPDGADIRTGVDFAAFAQGDYRTASKTLRAEWAFWRRTAKDYGFGRTELMPVRSTEEGIARYVGKYIGKHHAVREERDRGVRLVEYSRGARMAVTRFGWCSDNAAMWRAKVRLFAQIMSERIGKPIRTHADLTGVLGPRWAYWHRDFIRDLPVVHFGQGFELTTDRKAVNLTTGELIDLAP